MSKGKSIFKYSKLISLIALIVSFLFTVYVFIMMRHNMIGPDKYELISWNIFKIEYQESIDQFDTFHIIFTWPLIIYSTVLILEFLLKVFKKKSEYN